MEMAMLWSYIIQTTYLNLTYHCSFLCKKVPLELECHSIPLFVLSVTVQLYFIFTTILIIYHVNMVKRLKCITLNNAIILPLLLMFL